MVTTKKNQQEVTPSIHRWSTKDACLVAEGRGPAYQAAKKGKRWRNCCETKKSCDRFAVKAMA